MRIVESRGRSFRLRRGVFDPVRHLSGVAFASVLPGLLEDRVDADARIHDLGTGCGVLAAAAREVVTTVVATDISERAAKVAAENLADLSVDVRVGDLFDPVHGEWFDLIVMNPPYEIGRSRDLTLGSPDLLDRFGREVGTFSDHALIGWPADAADELCEAIGLPVECIAEVPTSGDRLAIFEWQVSTA